MAGRSEIVVRFAGEGGQGVVTAAEMMARAASGVGFHALTFATFPSQIIGGPTWTQARVSRCPVLSPGDTVDILVAFNAYAYEEHRVDVRDGGVILIDPSITPDPNDLAHRCIVVPFDELAKQTGEARAANMVVMGGLSRLVNMPLEYFKDFVSTRFAGREGVVEANHMALDLGLAHMAEEAPVSDLGEPDPPDYKQLFIKGNDAVSLGAMHAGVEFYMGYPISPATPILLYMERHLVGPGRFAYQASSEIESITSVLGASFAGKKAMTATSGPGFTLMTEGIGLAWMAELPCVIVNVQRGGPATGLPTKTEQSDLLAALTPAHGDSRLPVIAPGTVEECFYATVAAFNWAERAQCPVVLLSEHTLAERAQNIPKPDLDATPVESRLTYSGGEGGGENGYLRYDGWELSPMPVPGHAGAYTANGSEHDPYGDTTHLPARHVQMTERRFSKMKLLEDGTFESERPAAKIAVMPWGGSKGSVREAYELLREDGVDIGWFYTMFLNPLPPKLLEELQAKDLVIVPELNYQGQFASVLRSLRVNAEPITQYTGLPFKAGKLSERIRSMIASASKTPQAVKA
ncbi:MAG: 2-oxoacid:acceptor oxidoreductase subunit alpha [Chloroflexi bacterium]|nr:2-oxoacid:acceptor oxidoreductase subunit alpha [Chloroflexota bacterium]